MNNAQLATNILLEPRAAFSSLADRPRFWFPLLLLVLASGLGLVAYFQLVDFNWFNDQILRPAAAKVADEDAALVMSRGVFMGTSLAAMVLGIAVTRLLESTYFYLAGRVTNVERSFSHWLALSSWSALPLLLILAVTMGFLFVHPNGQVTQEELNVLSLNEVIFHVDRKNPWFGLLSALTVLHPWVWWLTALGVKVWSGRSAVFALAFSMVPWVVFYGAWVLIVLART